MNDLNASTSLLQDQLMRMNQEISTCPSSNADRLGALNEIRNDLVKALAENLGRTALSNISLEDVGNTLLVEGICGLLLLAPTP